MHAVRTLARILVFAVIAPSASAAADRDRPTCPPVPVVAPEPAILGTNPAHATDALARQAEAGDAQAQYEYAMRLYTGDGVAQDLEAARTWLQRAVDAGNGYAAFAMSVWLASDAPPESGSADAKTVFDLRLRAARAGVREAQLRVAYAYGEGEGVAKDPTLAAQWYERAAEQWDTDFQRALADLYERGDHVPQSRENAMRWYTRAADRGDVVAQRALAKRLIADGDLDDLLAGVTWLALAARADGDRALSDRTLAELSDDERAEVAARVDQWCPRAR